nr:HAD-IIB family hydrolase [Bacteroides clarus]
MRQDYRLLVLDLDGTLTNSKKEISPRNFRTLLRLQRQISVYRSEPYFLELVPLGIDKARSLAVLLEKIGITREEMIAMGDGYNDLSMIKYAGLGIAMGNAQEPVKAAADYIAPSNDEDGVAIAVEQHFLHAF